MSSKASRVKLKLIGNGPKVFNLNLSFIPDKIRLSLVLGLREKVGEYLERAF